MRRIRLIIAYDGTDYSGWQEQENATTIQGVVRNALAGLLSDCGEDTTDFSLIGASRTDAGVHSLGNVAVFDTDTAIPGEKYAYALNARLPENIRVLQSDEVSDNFHPRYSESHKTYVYQILNTRIAIPIYSRYMYHIYEDIDINKMLQAVDFFIGEHDFSAFCSAGAQVKSKVRTIEALSFTALDPMSGQMLTQPASLTEREKRGKIIRMEITGTGFLYNMVRIIAGTLIEVGLGRRSPESVEEAIRSGDRSMAGPTAPACGLTLKEIRYDPTGKRLNQRFLIV